MAPQNFTFFQKSSKNSSYDGLWSKMPLGSLQEPAKSLPRASQEPSQSPQEALHSLQKLPMRPTRGLQEPAPLISKPCLENPILKPLYSKPYLQNPVLKTLS